MMALIFLGVLVIATTLKATNKEDTVMALLSGIATAAGLLALMFFVSVMWAEAMHWNVRRIRAREHRERCGIMIADMRRAAEALVQHGEVFPTRARDMWRRVLNQIPFEECKDDVQHIVTLMSLMQTTTDVHGACGLPDTLNLRELDYRLWIEIAKYSLEDDEDDDEISSSNP